MDLLTYQDLEEKRNTGREKDVMELVLSAIESYKATEFYRTAVDAESYARWQNPTIMKYQKLLYTLTGRAVPDNFSANHKCASNFFNRFVTQENQYLLGNGAKFEDPKHKDKLGGDFDTRLQELGKWALIHGVSYAFLNLDHIETFKATEMAPLYDEETGALKAAVRFWQISPQKPLRCTLYEPDGYTEYIRRTSGEMEVLSEKRSYVQLVRHSEADGFEIVDGSNYPGFPIVPLWGNAYHQSSLVGLRGQIDAYDLIKSGFANDLDDASMIYWTLENAGGMTDLDLAKFIERMKTVRAAVVDGDDGAKATAHTMDVPYQSRETYLTRLEKDMYKDAMALDPEQIASGAATTATQIKAAYGPLDNKTDEFEYCVINFIQSLLALIGIEDTPSFNRSVIINQKEETDMVMEAAQYLDDETILNKLSWLTPDEVEQIMERRDESDYHQFAPEAPEEEVIE